MIVLTYSLGIVGTLLCILDYFIWYTHYMFCIGVLLVFIAVIIASIKMMDL